MRKFMNHKVGIILCSLLLLTGIVGIAAYYADADKSKNEMTIGGNNIVLEEDFEPPKELEPGVEFKKDVKVNNIGPVDCYVRIKAVFTNSDIGDYCTLDLNTTDYVYNSEDGYHYYIHKLEVGDKTQSLFTKVSVSDTIPNSDIKDFNILVYAESIQSDGFYDYTDAWDTYKLNKGN